MKVIIATISVLLAFSALGQTKYPDHYKTALFEGVLFGKGDNLFAKANAANPKRSEVLEAENTLKNKVDSLEQDFNKGSSQPIAIVQKYSQYKRQYFSYINEKKEKVIIITFHYFPAPDNTYHWSKEPILVSDGGDRFWWVSYNLKTKSLFDLSLSIGGG